MTYGTLDGTAPRASDTVAAFVAGATVVKRDGKQERFDPAKVRRALTKCFAASGQAEPGAVAEVAAQVVNRLARGARTVGVEDIQRVVIEQLWALGYPDRAEHYTLYREQARRARQQRPLDPAHRERIDRDAQYFPTPIQYYQFLSKFARWDDDAKRRETWTEACDRAVGWLLSGPRVRGKLTEAEEAELHWGMRGMHATCALRVLQMAGPALDRCNMGVYNCTALPIKDLACFAELLYILMQGCGAGFSVESQFIGQLPRVRRQKAGRAPRPYTVGDSTEAWCDALLAGLQAWFAGEDVTFDLTPIRRAGARLKTKGGRASGPEPLKALLTFARNLILGAQGRYLTDLECHDLCCMIAKIVQVGGVRRASTISVSDLDSAAMRLAKHGNWWEAHGHRAMANNSAAYDEPPDALTFMEEWHALARSGSGERGLFNRHAIHRRLPARRNANQVFLVNPCGEIILRPFGCCNLSIAVARRGDTPEILRRKVRAAATFGVLQKTRTDFRYVREEWKNNCEEEGLLGVDITGHADCEILHPRAPGRDGLLRDLREEVARVDAELSARFGVVRSAADTCVKPGGDSAVLFDCGSGVSARFAPFWLRRVRESKLSPLCKFLQDAGVPWQQAPEDPSLVAFEFPMRAPAGAITRGDLTAVEQLDNVLAWARNWAEHSVSCTVYVGPTEWLAAGNWVYEHFDDVPALAFLPRDNGTYACAPNEEVTEEEFHRRVAAFPALDWAKLTRYEDDDHTEAARTIACSGDKCEMG